MKKKEFQEYEDDESDFEPDSEIKANPAALKAFMSVKKGIKAGKLNRENIIDLVDTIVRRKRIEFTRGTLVSSFMLNFCFCSKLCCKKSSRQQRILERGFMMLQKYFDVGKLFRSVNLSALMMASVMSKEQRLLLMFQRRQVIEEAEFTNEVSSAEDMAASF